GGTLDGYVAAHVKRAVGAHGHDIARIRRLCRTAILALVVQRAGWTALDYRHDGVGAGVGRLNPRALAGIEDGGQPAHALGGVDAALRVEGHIDGVTRVALGLAAHANPPVDALLTRSWYS